MRFGFLCLGALVSMVGFDVRWAACASVTCVGLV